MSRINRAIRKMKDSFSLAGFLRVVAWIFIIVAAGMGSTGILLVLVGQDQWRQVLPVSTLAFAAAGVLISVAGHLFTQSRDLKESQEKRSEFYLESCIKAYEEAKKC